VGAEPCNLGLERGYGSATGSGDHDGLLGFAGVWAAVIHCASEKPTSTGHVTILSIDTHLSESFGELKMIMLRTTT
jgi:hypothetical protein